MDIDAFRFLSKPLDTLRFMDGLNKAVKLIDSTVVEFMLKDGSTVYKIDSDTIVYVEIVGRNTKVVTRDKEYISENSIDYWRKSLDASYFYQVHKSLLYPQSFGIARLEYMISFIYYLPYLYTDIFFV